jgi:hypothetical protein
LNGGAREGRHIPGAKAQAERNLIAKAKALAYPKAKDKARL